MLDFTNANNLSEVAGKTFRLTCPDCQHAAEVTATTLMIHRGGAAKLHNVWQSITCKGCGRRGKPTVELLPRE